MENPCSQGKKTRTWSNRTELSLKEKQYQLLYRWSRTAIELLTSFQNIIKETYREKQSFNLWPRTGSVHNVAKRERQIEACPVAALHYLPPLCGHFDPMWSTKWALKLSLLITLGYGTSYSMGLFKEPPTYMGPTHDKSPLLPKDGFSYLPHSFMLWKPAMMDKRRMNTIKLLLRQLNLEQ